MPTKRKAKSTAGAERLFVPELGLTEAGSIRLRFRPAPPLRSLYGHERDLAAFIYDLAAVIERRCKELGVPWAVSPDPFNARLDLEIGEEDDPEAAGQLVAGVLSDLGVG
jgi:hypothetical protein